MGIKPAGGLAHQFPAENSLVGRADRFRSQGPPRSLLLRVDRPQPSEPTRVNPQRFAQHKFHREICNRRHTRTRMRLLKPRFGLLDKRFLSVEISQQSLKLRVGSNTLQFFSRYGLQQNPRIMRQFPEFGVELLPKLIRGVIEGPSKVQSQVGKSIRNGCIGGTINICWSTHRKLLLLAYRPRPLGCCGQAFPRQWSGLLLGSVVDGPGSRNSQRKSCRFLPCLMDVLQTSHLWQLL